MCHRCVSNETHKYAREKGLCTLCDWNFRNVLSFLVALSGMLMVLTVLIMEAIMEDESDPSAVIRRLGLTHMQFLGMIASFFDRPPSPYDWSVFEFLAEYAGTFGGSADSVFRWECWAPYDQNLPPKFSKMAMFNFLVPSICFVCIIFWIAYGFVNRSGRFCFDLRTRSVSSILSILFFFYPTLAKVLELLKCEDIGGRLYLKDDNEVECWTDPRHLDAVKNILLPSLGVFVLGVPLLIALGVFVNRKTIRVRGSAAERQFRIVTAGFRKKFLWYGSVGMLKKVTFISFAVLTVRYNVTYQAYSCFVLLVICTIFDVTLQPFDVITGDYEYLRTNGHLRDIYRKLNRDSNGILIVTMLLTMLQGYCSIALQKQMSEFVSDTIWYVCDFVMAFLNLYILVWALRSFKRQYDAEKKMRQAELVRRVATSHVLFGGKKKNGKGKKKATEVSPVPAVNQGTKPLKMTPDEAKVALLVSVRKRYGPGSGEYSELNRHLDQYKRQKMEAGEVFEALQVLLRTAIENDAEGKTLALLRLIFGMNSSESQADVVAEEIKEDPAAQWIESRTKTGKVYYRNMKTGVTTFEKPEGFAPPGDEQKTPLRKPDGKSKSMALQDVRKKFGAGSKEYADLNKKLEEGERNGQEASEVLSQLLETDGDEEKKTDDPLDNLLKDVGKMNL